MEQRKCSECKELIFNGRSDKKFCCDACRNAFNNRINQKSNNYVRNISNALMRNRRALAAYAEKQIVSIQELTKAGFSFDYFTHTDKQHDVTTFFVFDFGYKFSEGQFLNIVIASPSGDPSV